MMRTMEQSPEESTPQPGAAKRTQPSAFSQALGARLRELREERGWSQRELGTRLGILQSKLSKYESGTHQPSLRTLVRMASVFAVTTDYLLTGAKLTAPPLRDDRLLDRLRRLGAAGDEMRGIVVAILDGILALDARFRQLGAGAGLLPVRAVRPPQTAATRHARRQRLAAPAQRDGQR
jgi:putative transcriptional regulator